MRYYVIHDDGERYGPVDVETLRLWASEGRLVADSSVEEEGTGKACRADIILGLASFQEASEARPRIADESNPDRPPLSAVRKKGFIGRRPFLVGGLEGAVIIVLLSFFSWDYQDYLYQQYGDRPMQWILSSAVHGFLLGSVILGGIVHWLSKLTAEKTQFARRTTTVETKEDGRTFAVKYGCWGALAAAAIFIWFPIYGGVVAWLAKLIIACFVGFLLSYTLSPLFYWLIKRRRSGGGDH